MKKNINAFLTGMGVSGGNKIYSTPIFGMPQHFKVNNVDEIFLALRVWADQWAHKEVLFGCDTWAVDQVIHLFIWGFMSLSTLYRSYHNG